jgi:hypothetical protein
MPLKLRVGQQIKNMSEGAFEKGIQLSEAQQNVLDNLKNKLEPLFDSFKSDDANSN